MMPRFFHCAAALVAGLVAASPLPAERIKIAAPAARAWCIEQSVPIDEGSADMAIEAQVDQARDGATKALDQQLFERGIFYSGMPFVASPRKIVSAPPPPASPPAPPVPGAAAAPPPAASQAFLFNLCAIVDATNATVVPAEVKPLVMAAANYSALDCGTLSDDDCLATLRKEMVEAFGSAKEGEIASSPIIETHVADPVNAASIADAYRNARDRVTWKALSLAAKTSSGVDPANIARRPLAIDENAGINVEGVPQNARKVLMIRDPG